VHARHLADSEARWRKVAVRLDAIAADPTRLPGASAAAVAAAQASVAAWVDDTHHRVGLVRLPRARRVGAILRAWAQGRYRRFQLPGAVLIDLLAVRAEPPERGS
jgi:hypothetical protein